MADSQIHNDPDKLRNFALQLNRFAATSEEHLGRLKSAIGRLSQSWRDQEFDRFVQQFATAESRLKGFIEETKRVAPSLEDDASKLEDYLKFKSGM